MAPTLTPFLSVIIPVYNGEKYLGDAIHSVLDPGHAPMEVIVVDDGSTDGTAEIACEFDGRVSYVAQANHGPAAARNRGLQLARGEVVGFLDADDLWTENVVTRALASLTERQDVDIVQGRIQEIKPRASGATGSAYACFARPYPFINIGSAVYRKKVFAKVGGFDETMRFCEDYDWFLRAFDARIPKLRIDEVTLLYRTHADSMTHGKSVHEIGMAKAHKKAIQRRRQGAVGSNLPPLFPTLAEYIGSRPATASRDDVSEDVSESDHDK
jgi:glycosyltransferase involved in cell wall biosynthesis